VEHYRYHICQEKAEVVATCDYLKQGVDLPVEFPERYPLVSEQSGGMYVMQA